MPRVLFQLLMAGFLVAVLAFPAHAQRQKGGGGDRMRGGYGGGSNRNGSSSNTNKARPSPSLRLPDQFRSIDRDNDGQIGLYEWSKTDYPGFLRLDLNHDGFLTPQELTLAGSKAAPPRTSDVSASSSSGESGSSAEASAAPAADAGPAESLFTLMDKDKDGRISESEWKKSFLAPPKFEAAGIKFQFPIGRPEFLKEYPKAFGPG